MSVKTEDKSSVTMSCEKGVDFREEKSEQQSLLSSRNCYSLSKNWLQFCSDILSRINIESILKVDTKTSISGELLFPLFFFSS